MNCLKCGKRIYPLKCGNLCEKCDPDFKIKKTKVPTKRELKIAESCETFTSFLISADIPWKYQFQISNAIKQAFIEGMRYQKNETNKLLNLINNHGTNN